MSMWRLENSRFQVTIRSLGAEVCSVWDKTLKREWIWQPRAGIWNNSATQLFPVVGRMIHDGLYLESHHLPLPAHGFLRYQHFMCLETDRDHLVLEARATDETFAVFPWPWAVRMTWTLNNDGLHFTQQVVNEGRQPFAYSIGWHPGFSLPITEQTGWCVDFSSGGVSGPFPTQNRTLALPETQQLASSFLLEASSFAYGAVYFGNAKGQSISVLDPMGKKAMTITADNHPWLALWGVPGANLLCIEPLAGTTDAPDFDGQLCHKRGMQWIMAGKSQMYQIGIRFEVDLESLAGQNIL